MANPIRVDSAGGEYMESVVVLEWTAKIGDAVKAGDLLVTVETAKAATEIEVPCDGYLTAIFAETGTEVPLSAVLGLIGVTVEDKAFEGAVAPVAPAPLTPGATAESPVSAAVSPQGSAANNRLIASPAARRQAVHQGVDLRGVRASSPTGRIKLRDLVQVPASQTYGLQAPALSTLPPDDHGPLKIYRSGPKTGTPLVMIHGFGADAQSWFPLERDLARSTPVIRIELPNHGQSPKRRVGSFANLARDITAAFDALHVDDAHIIGHSLGGACALSLADIRPRQIASLTLLAPGGLGAAINGGFVDGLARASRPESLGPWLRLMVADPKIIGDDFVVAAMASRADPTLRAAQQQMARDLFPDATQGFDLRAALARLHCPTRIIWGRADAVLPWQQALAAPGRIGLHLLEATGHVPQLERTDEVLAILRAQLREGVSS
ncbi:MAG: acetoin dehydrogenase dihydrolipoyllysine-residue acetyltransferase subunit [Pseudomonadota bacterium]